MTVRIQSFDACLVLSAPETACFFDLLFQAAGVLEKSEQQKSMLSFLKELRDTAIGKNTEFQLGEMPWQDSSFLTDCLFFIQAADTAKTLALDKELPEGRKPADVFLWFNTFSGMFEKMMSGKIKFRHETGSLYTDIKECLPANKSDERCIEKLLSLTDAEIEPILPELLTWIQDVNWPVCRKIIKVIARHREAAEPFILEILKGNDAVWKYNIISELLYEWPEYPYDPVTSEIIRIAGHPSREESGEEVNIAAEEFLNAMA